MMLSRKPQWAFLAACAICSCSSGVEVREIDSPLTLTAPTNNETGKAWKLFKESLQDQAPLLSALRSEEKQAKAKSKPNLRATKDSAVEDDDDMAFNDVEDLDVMSAASDANDAAVAAAEAAVTEAEAFAKADGDAIDAAAEGKQDTRPVTDTASAFEHDVTDLILGLGKGGFAATPMGDSVRKMKQLINQVMLDKVKSAHKTDQSTLSNLVKTIKSCGKVKTDSFNQASTNERAYKTNSPLHKSCRFSEANLATEASACKEGKKQALTMAKLHCQSFVQVEKTVANQVMNSALVKKAASEAAETYVRRLSSTICGASSDQTGYLDKFLKAKKACDTATAEYKAKVKECTKSASDYKAKQSQCTIVQAQMDNAACTWAVQIKDACENYVGCYSSKKSSYVTMEKVVRKNEKDRKGEWRGLMRMQCLIDGFSDGKVTDKEVDDCKAKSHSTSHLNINYPEVPELETCAVPKTYPATAAYKRAEFASLPALAKGQADANECTGVEEVSTTPAAGSPSDCKCERLTLIGEYSAGPLIKCTGCLDVYRSNDRSSCPRGTKIFSPRSRADWQTVKASVTELPKSPNFIIDITRPQNGCAGCRQNAMNSRNGAVTRKGWDTADGSPWWLTPKVTSKTGGYTANCFLHVRSLSNLNGIQFKSDSCNYHSSSYLCQPGSVPTKPKAGSPKTCRCTNVALTGRYSAGALVKCEHCWVTSKSRDKNSCPRGMKLFSPSSREDWKVVLASAGSLRNPNWIVDVTRPSNGCGGCKNVMNSDTASQATWRTADGSPWWLRSTTYSEPSGDYNANCYMDLWKVPNSEDDITFNDAKGNLNGGCRYSSASYYCQPARSRLG